MSNERKATQARTSMDDPQPAQGHKEYKAKVTVVDADPTWTKVVGWDIDENTRVFFKPTSKDTHLAGVEAICRVGVDGSVNDPPTACAGDRKCASIPLNTPGKYAPSLVADARTRDEHVFVGLVSLAGFDPKKHKLVVDLLVITDNG